MRETQRDTVTTMVEYCKMSQALHPEGTRMRDGTTSQRIGSARAHALAGLSPWLSTRGAGSLPRWATDAR